MSTAHAFSCLLQCSVCYSCLLVINICMHDMQLHNEYEKDKQQAMDRIAAEVEQSIVNMRNGIEQKYDRYRNELIQKLETEQKDRLAAIKRRQWVSFMSLFIVKEN